jgi:putative FmdB family regulatory protein
MPIYEFQCKRCGTDSELLVRSSEWKGEKCPACGSARLSKKLSAFAVSGSDEFSSEVPACSGNPGACGRCGD